MADHWTPKVLGHLSLLCAFVTWYVVFTSIGFASLSQDAAISADKCGARSHMLKYATLNSVFATLILLSYAVFPGGGEGARARAMLITIVHGSLAMWGLLMEMALPHCMSLISDKFYLMYIFHKIAIYHNMAFCTLMFVHEIYLGDKIQADLTLIPEVRTEQMPDEYEYANVQGTNGYDPGFAEKYLDTATDTALQPTTSGVAELLGQGLDSPIDSPMPSSASQV